MVSLFESADCIVSNRASEPKSLKNLDDKDGPLRAPTLSSLRSSAKTVKPGPTASVSQVVEPSIASDEFDKVFRMVE